MCCVYIQLWLVSKLALDNIYTERPLQPFYEIPNVKERCINGDTFKNLYAEGMFKQKLIHLTNIHKKMHLFL